MKIAETYEKETGNVFQHFGKTQYFKIYEIEDGKVISSDVIDNGENGNYALPPYLKSLGDSNYFAIELKESCKVIGEIFAHPEGTDPTESVKDTFSPCWMLNERYQNKGYMTEAARAYISYLFEKCGARRIYAYLYLRKQNTT